MKLGRVFFVSIMILMFVLSVFSVNAREDTTIDTVIEDGDIKEKSGAYTRDNIDGEITAGIIVGDPDYYRGYIEFDISNIPAAAIIDTVTLWYQLEISVTNTQTIREMTTQPSVTANAATWADAGNGDIYATAWGTGALNTWLSKTLSADAAADLQANLAVDWFALGFTGDNVGTLVQMHSSEEAGREPYLVVSWHLAADTVNVFTGTYYENGTITTAETVTASIPAGNEEFDADGTVSQYYPTDPEAWYWDIGGGATRYIYAFGGDENFTVTIPDGADYSYSFTVRDFTGKIGTGSYLEAYRTISGSQTLITRMPIDTPNPVTMNLVFGKTYRMKILFEDGTRYDWGYLIPGSDTTLTLILRTIQFSDSAQILYNHIHVDVTRNTVGDTITIDYLDDLNRTVWANVTISIRNGAIAIAFPRENGTYTVNWAAADPDVSYIVVITGSHLDYGAWGRSFILDATETFPAAPDLNGIFGDVSSDFIPWIIVALVGISFSKTWGAPGLLAMMFVATFLSGIGWASWSYDVLAFGWFLSVGVVLTKGGEG